MRKVKEVLRLKHECGLSNRQISRSCSLSHSTIGGYLDRFTESGLTWGEAKNMGEEELLSRLMIPPESSDISVNTPRPLPDWGTVYSELKSKGVTLKLLWHEYRQNHSNGYGYSQFCARYKDWSRGLRIRMRQNHKAGEKLFVDYAGPTIAVVDVEKRRINQASIFVAALGASNYTYVEAQSHEDQKNWLGGHVRAFEYFGAVPRLVVPDNLKTGVKSPCFYEPDINAAYHDMARHYQLAVIPARVRRPRDKAKVEVAVQIVSRWIIAALRKRTFFSLQELNQAIKQLLEKLNDRPIRHLGKSRRELFEEIDKPAMKPLPQKRYEYCQWKKASVGIDYHVRFDKNFYSVPYSHIHKKVLVRATEQLIEIFLKSQRIASHLRSYGENECLTQKEHMPQSHQFFLEWTPQRLLRWSDKIGSHTNSLIQIILNSGDYPQQSFRKCLGILKLANRFGNERLEACCKRALEYGITSYKKIKNILDKGLDKLDLPEGMDSTSPVLHSNIRGEQYYDEESK